MHEKGKGLIQSVVNARSRLVFPPVFISAPASRCVSSTVSRNTDERAHLFATLLRTLLGQQCTSAPSSLPDKDRRTDGRTHGGRNEAKLQLVVISRAGARNERPPKVSHPASAFRCSCVGHQLRRESATCHGINEWVLNLVRRRTQLVHYYYYDYYCYYFC